MNYDSILLRYGELFLKGRNALWFEKKLIENLRKLVGIKAVKRVRGRLILDYFEVHQQLKKVFGLVSYSPALRVEKELEAIKTAVWEHFKDKKGSFRIETKRSDKSFSLKSLELNALLGRFLEENNKNLSFGFENYQHFLNIEINLDGAYLFTETIDCFGGLPVGTGGRVALLMENEASILAGLLVMKRGCNLFPIGFKEQNLKEPDLSLLQKFSPASLTFKLVKDWGEIDAFAQEKEILSLVVGDTFEDKKQYPTNLMVLKPLVVYSKIEIKRKLIGFVNYSPTHFP